MEEQLNGGANGGAGLSIASMVLGIVALVMSCCFYYVSIPCAILSIIFAGVALKKGSSGKGMAVAGLVCSIISIIPAVIVMMTGAALLSSLGSL